MLFKILETTVEDQAVHVGGGSMARLVHTAFPHKGLVLLSVRWIGDLEKTVSNREDDGVVGYERKGKKMCRKDR